MYRGNCAPSPWEYDTEDEYNAALDAYDAAMSLAEDEAVERRCEREQNI